MHEERDMRGNHPAGTPAKPLHRYRPNERYAVDMPRQFRHGSGSRLPEVGGQMRDKKLGNGA